MNRTDAHRNLLLTLLKKTREIESQEVRKVPSWKGWKNSEIVEQKSHGPLYVPSEWFGEIPDAEQLRYRRAIVDLHKAGLVEPWARYGRRLTNLAITTPGREVAEGFELEPEKLSEISSSN